jgi:hypothetical protein
MNLTFDPLSIPASQGELIYVGDILLNDVSVTHQGQYLEYLRNEVLHSHMPDFDNKMRHSNPIGSRITILTVRCGQQSSLKISALLYAVRASIPRCLYLGASQTSKHNHKRIFKVHNEYLADMSHLIFSASEARSDERPRQHRQMDESCKRQNSKFAEKGTWKELPISFAKTRILPSTWYFDVKILPRMVPSASTKHETVYGETSKKLSRRLLLQSWLGVLYDCSS